MKRLDGLYTTVFSVEITHKGDLLVNQDLLVEQLEDMYFSFANIVDLKPNFTGRVTMRRKRLFRAEDE